MPTTVVLGAGASVACALHFHRHRKVAQNPPLDANFFERIQTLGITIPTELRRYASRMAAIDPFSPSATGGPVRMEEFFKELFADFQDDPEPSRLPSKAYAQLVDIYVRVLRETTNWICSDSRRGSPLGVLINQLADETDDLSVITFNHDLIIENEIYKRARLRKRWCLREGYGSFGQSLPLSNPSNSAHELFPDHSASCDHSRPLTIYKLHGSLNWYVRLQSKNPTKRILAGAGSAPPVNMTTRRTVTTQLRYTASRTGRGRTSWYTWPVVIPPVSEKDALIRSYLAPVWTEAREALERSTRLPFVGYSLPLLDTGAERLFQRVLTRQSGIPYVELIDPSPLAPARYAQLAPHLTMHWYPGIDHFINK